VIGREIGEAEVHGRVDNGICLIPVVAAQSEARVNAGVHDGVFLPRAQRRSHAVVTAVTGRGRDRVPLGGARRRQALRVATQRVSSFRGSGLHLESVEENHTMGGGEE
jgi:hypothetical protein